MNISSSETKSALATLNHTPQTTNTSCTFMFKFSIQSPPTPCSSWFRVSSSLNLSLSAETIASRRSTYKKSVRGDTQTLGMVWYHWDPCNSKGIHKVTPATPLPFSEIPAGRRAPCPFGCVPPPSRRSARPPARGWSRSPNGAPSPTPLPPVRISGIISFKCEEVINVDIEV